MSDRDLDRRCAEILGWTSLRLDYKDDWVGINPKDKQSKILVNSEDDVPFYSTSLDSSRELLEWAYTQNISRSNGIAFGRKLRDMIKLNLPYWQVPYELFQLTPLQICEAFVKCFGEPK